MATRPCAGSDRAVWFRPPTWPTPAPSSCGPSPRSRSRRRPRPRARDRAAADSRPRDGSRAKARAARGGASRVGILEPNSFLGELRGDVPPWGLWRSDAWVAWGARRPPAVYRGPGNSRHRGLVPAKRVGSQTLVFYPTLAALQIVTSLLKRLLDAFALFAEALADLLDLGSLLIGQRGQLGRLLLVESLEPRRLALLHEHLALLLERLELGVEFLPKGLELRLEGSRLRLILLTKRSD